MDYPKAKDDPLGVRPDQGRTQAEASAFHPVPPLLTISEYMEAEQSRLVREEYVIGAASQQRADCWG